MGEKKIIPMKPKSSDTKIDLNQLVEKLYSHESRIGQLEKNRETVLELKDQVGGVIETQEKHETQLVHIEIKVDDFKTRLDEKSDGIKLHFKEEIKGLKTNSRTFRLWLTGVTFSATLSIFGGIWLSLSTGLKYYREDKKDFEKRIEKKVDKIDGRIEKFIEQVMKNRK